MKKKKFNLEDFQKQVDREIQEEAAQKRKTFGWMTFIVGKKKKAK